MGRDDSNTSTDNSNEVDFDIDVNSNNNYDILESDMDNSIHSTHDSSEHEVLSSASEIFERNPESINEFLQDDVQKEMFLLTNLREWARKGISFVKIDDLLKILSVLFPNLPRNYKSLVHTPRKTVTIPLGNGKFFYKDIRKNIDNRLLEQYFVDHQEIIIDVNINGLDPFKSTNDCFWTILGCFKDDPQPFIIAAYFGKGKPYDMETFLGQYVEEVKNLQERGVEVFNHIYPFQVRNYVLDAPARSLVKCIIGHNGRFACEKCEVEGEYYLSRQIFVNLDAVLRTDESFRIRTNIFHHTNNSPLERIPTGMVSQFRLDALHLVYAGVWKRWLSFVLISKNRRSLALEADVLEMNNKISWLASYIPKDFNRRPRTFKHFAKFKGTEFRRILLYDGLIVFNHLDRKLWKSYILLQSSIYMLARPDLVQDMTPVADVIIRQFIKHAITIFGKQFVVYNVHSLCHLSEECRLHGAIDSFSAFKYENFFMTIKNCLRSTSKPLQQLVNRDFETKGYLTSKIYQPDDQTVKLKGLCKNIKDNIQGDVYSPIEIGGILLNTDLADRCFFTKSGIVVVLKNVINTREGRIILNGQKFRIMTDYYTYPCHSSQLGIWKVSSLNPEVHAWNISQFAAKCVLLPLQNEEFLTVPLVHNHK